MKRRLALLAASFCLFIHGCGNSSDGWRTIHPQGVDCSFELPEPVNNPQRPGYQMYESQAGDVKVQVGIFPRAFAEPEPGATDAEILNKFEKAMLKLVQDNLVATGYEPQLELDGDLAVQDGLGQQIRMIVGQQFVLNLFYITPRGLYYIKIDNGDQNNPAIKRIIETFQP